MTLPTATRNYFQWEAGTAAEPLGATCNAPVACEPLYVDFQPVAE